MSLISTVAEWVTNGANKAVPDSLTQYINQNEA